MTGADWPLLVVLAAFGAFCGLLWVLLMPGEDEMADDRYEWPRGQPPGCECGADAPCLLPAGLPPAEWAAWWAKHPARAGILPLTSEAGRRRGGRR